MKNTLNDINQYLKNTLTPEETLKAKKRLELIAKNNWNIKKKSLTTKTMHDKLKKPITPNWLMMNIANNITKNNIVVEEGLVRQEHC